MNLEGDTPGEHRFGLRVSGVMVPLGERVRGSTNWMPTAEGPMEIVGDRVAVPVEPAGQRIGGLADVPIQVMAGAEGAMMSIGGRRR